MLGPQTFATDPNGCYIAIYADPQPGGPQPALLVPKLRAATVINLLSHIYNRNIFDREIFRGAIVGRSKHLHVDATVMLIEPPSISKEDIEEHLGTVPQRYFDDHKLRLMSNFYARAWALDFAEEKFLLLWTILEIYPMEGTTDIKPIKKLIRKLVTGKPDDTSADSKIDVGRLFGLRSKIVHDGYIEMEPYKLMKNTEILLDIVHCAIREYLGLNYDGSLDRHPIPDQAPAAR